MEKTIKSKSFFEDFFVYFSRVNVQSTFEGLLEKI